MVQPLSERLEELSARAKRAEEDVAKASAEGEEKLRAHLDALKSDVASRADRVEEHVSSTWTELREKLRSEVDSIKADIDERKYERDARHASKQAEKAEERAAAAILFAIDAIDYAETTVIDAILSREEANSYTA